MDVCRRLADADPQTKELPAACKEACPNAESVTKAQETAMMGAMMPHMAKMQTMQSKMQTMHGKNPTPAQMKTMMDGMMPMYEALFTVVFQIMCTNKATYLCMTTNHAVCTDKPQDQSEISMGVSIDDPAKMAKDYGPVLGCICDVCPGAKKCDDDRHGKYGLKYGLWAEWLAAGGSSTAGAQSDGDRSALKAQCVQLGISTGATLAPVTTVMKIAGIDFAKSQK